MPLRQTTRHRLALPACRGLAYSCDISDVPAETERALAGLDVWIVTPRDKPPPQPFQASPTRCAGQIG